MKMIPASVALRQKGAHDFAGCYDNLCALQSTAPLANVKAHLQNGILDINGDRLRLIDWPPILNTLKLNKNLRYVAFRSYFQPQANNGKKQHYFRRRVPAVRNKQITLFIAKSLSACLSISKAIKCVDLQGVPLREKDIKIIAEGLSKNKSLTHILFDYCQITDSGVYTLCQVIRNHLTITHLSLSGCNITSKGAENISKLIKHQSMKRHSEAWADGLRHRTPNLDCMSGIRRITLNSNPMISDEGAVTFADALRDDLWVKALDVQHCGLTTEGANYLFSAIEHNHTICVLDIRRNPMIDGATLRKLLGRVLFNVKESDEYEFPWIKEERPKDPYRTKRPKNLNLSKVSSKKSQEGNPHPAGVPWRTAVRASQHKVDISGNESSDDVIIINPKSATPEPKVNADENLGSFTSKSKVNESSYVKQLEIALLDFKRRLAAATENEKKMNAAIMTLEMENSKLRNELKESYTNVKIKSQIEDDYLLDSIEKSFSKFHEFLNTLGDLGLGSLVAEAGLTNGAFSLPFSTSNKPDDDEYKTNLVTNKTPGTNVNKKEEKRKNLKEGKRREGKVKRELSEESLPISSAIVIEGGTNKLVENENLDSTKSNGTSSKSSKSTKSRNKLGKNDQNSSKSDPKSTKSQPISVQNQESSLKNDLKSQKSDKISTQERKVSGRIETNEISEKISTEEISEEILSEINSSDDTF